MGKAYDAIDDKLREFIEAQHVFFVGTAPRSAEGLLNISPKGLDSFRVLGPDRVAYLDITGSGIETVAHLKENGRITIMFCAFEGRPLILRLYGRGRAIERDDPEWASLIGELDELPGLRSIVLVDVERIADSCGWGVPEMSFVGPRDQLVRYAEQLGDEGLREAQSRSNLESLDGLPGLSRPSV